MRAVRFALATAMALATVLACLACGETRRPIGDECLRADDCLSSVCSSRTCVAAPVLVNGGSGPPADEVPRIPIDDGGAEGSADARGGG